jgi:hypothetical protein
MDDLQEAAAGLAKLMRSSPVARVEPVVFAPGEVVAEPVEETPAAEIQEVEESVAAEIQQEVEAPRILSLRDLLGDTVADQFDRIDEGLDALESLVIGIESSLSALADLERGDLEGDHHEEVDAVAAAA